MTLLRESMNRVRRKYQTYLPTHQFIPPTQSTHFIHPGIPSIRPLSRHHTHTPTIYLIISPTISIIFLSICLSVPTQPTHLTHPSSNLSHPTRPVHMSQPPMCPSIPSFYLPLSPSNSINSAMVSCLYPLTGPPFPFIPQTIHFPPIHPSILPSFYLFITHLPPLFIPQIFNLYLL